MQEYNDVCLNPKVQYLYDCLGRGEARPDRPRPVLQLHLHSLSLQPTVGTVTTSLYGQHHQVVRLSDEGGVEQSVGELHGDPLEGVAGVKLSQTEHW